MAMTMGSKAVRRSESSKVVATDCSLQLENMKLESLVIADQHAAVNMCPGPFSEQQGSRRGTCGWIESLCGANLIH